MEYHFSPKGVCSTQFHTEVSDEGIIKSLTVENGCNGNGKGIGNLLRGMTVDEAVKRLEGVRCGRKKTSCPDQMAIMYAEIREKLK